MGQNPVPAANIPITTKIGSKMGGAPIPKWDPIGFEPWPNPKVLATLPWNPPKGRLKMVPGNFWLIFVRDFGGHQHREGKGPPVERLE